MSRALPGPGDTKLCCAQISWKAGRLQFTSLSSCESEYIAATKATVTIKTIRGVKSFFGQKPDLPTILFCDNKAACMLSEKNTSSKRMKHIATRVHFLQEAVEGKEICLQHIRTTGQIADIFTKPLGASVFHTFRQLLVG